MNATGAGITEVIRYGKERVLEACKILKNEFGDDFHLHMYTSIPFKAEWAKISPKPADEIASTFSIWNPRNIPKQWLPASNLAC